MRTLRIALISQVLASTLSACIIVARPYHLYHLGPPRCYGCW